MKENKEEKARVFLFKDGKSKERFFCSAGLKPFKFSDEAETRRLKIPIVVEGKYKHSVYGDVDFSKEVIQKIKENFLNKVTGFEPPVFLGHPIDTDSAEAHPAIAFIYDVFEEDNVFWADAEVVDDEAYDAIKKGKFRYASAEVVREYPSKFEEASLGPTLIGLAITNRPFIPNMPRVEAHSDPNTSNCTENFTIEQFNLVNITPLAENKSMVNPTENTLEEKKAEQIDLADKFLALVQQVEEAKTKAERAEAKLKEIEKQDTLSKVDSFNLSEGVKQEFKQLFSSNSFTEDQTKNVLSALEKFSNENNALLLTQHGKQENEVQTLSDKKEVEAYAESPYKRIIEANLKMAEAKRSK